MRFISNRTKILSKLLSLSLILMQSGIAVSAVGPVDETALRKAWAFYSAKNYVASADAFEVLIRTSTPNARLYYYAAAANKSGNRIERAKQLCQYVVANFPTSTEAASAKQLFPETATKTEFAPELPDSLKGKNLEELMQTEEGRKALKEALQKQQAAKSGAPAVAMGTPVSKEKSKASDKGNNRPYTAESIAKDGADGITQFIGYPDCSFECSMASLAMLPRGQKLMADMIRTDGKDTHFVRFPGADGVEYAITPEKMEACRVKDKALWATVIHCALTIKFRNSYHGTLEEGMSCMTGKKADKLFSKNTTEQSLTSFIGGALKAQNPIVCEAVDDFDPLEELVETGQAYSITDFDAASGMITIRNPHAANSRRFRLKTDPEHKKFEQLNDGIFKMHVSLFPQYFDHVVSSPI